MKAYLDPILADGIGGGNPVADQSGLIQEISHGFREGEQVIILVGRSGTGKSTLLRSIPTDARRILNLLTFPELADVNNFLNNIAYQFGLRRGDTLTKLGMSLPGDTVRIAQSPATHKWSDHEVSELIGELAATDKSSTQSVLRIDHCERSASATPDELIALRGACLASSSNFRVILAVRQDSLGMLLDALDGCLARAPHIIFVHGIELAAATAFAQEVVDGAGIKAVSADFIRKLIGSLERGGYVWPVALNAILEELTLAQSDMKLLNATRFSPRDIDQFLGRSVARRLASAPEGLSDECYWTLRAIGRNEQLRRVTSEQSLIAGSTTRNLSELRAVLDHLAMVRLVTCDSRGNWNLAHEAIARALQQLTEVRTPSSDSEILDVIERWQVGARLSVADATKLLSAIRIEPTLPLPALILLSMGMATGLVSDMPGTIALMQRKLADSKTEDICGVARSMRAALNGRDAPMLMAALLYSGTAEGIRAFLDDICITSSAEWEWGVASNIERLLMGVEANPLIEAIENDEIIIEKPVVLSALMRVMLRRNDVSTSTEGVIRMVDAVKSLDPELALGFVSRFDQPALTIHCQNFLQSGGTSEILAALVVLTDAHEMVVSECAASVARLINSTDAMIRRRALSLFSARPEVFRESLVVKVSNEPSPLVREGVLEILRPEHPEATQIIVDALTDPFDFVRESAVYAAGRCALAPETLSTSLLEATRDQSEKVREAAIRVGQRFDIKLPISDMLMGLRSRNESLLSAFLAALGAESIEDIDLALSDASLDSTLSKDIRLAALSRLGERGGEIAVWTVSTLLSDRDPEILATALISAQMVADVRHIDELRRLSRHPLAVVRERVVYAMAEIGGKEAVEMCLEQLFDPVSEIRARAVYALLRLGAVKHRQAIEETLRHEDSDAVLAALSELRKALSHD